MDEEAKNQSTGETGQREDEQPALNKIEQEQEEEAKKSSKLIKKKCRKPEHKNRKHAKKVEGKKKQKEDSATESDSESDSDEEDSSSESSSSEELTKKRQKDARKKKAKALKKKGKKQDDSTEAGTSDSSESQQSESSSSQEELKKRKSKKATSSKKSKEKKLRKVKKPADESDSDSEDESDVGSDSGGSAKGLQKQFAELQRKMSKITKRQSSKSKSPKIKKKSSKTGLPQHFKRVDELWDSTIHAYRLKESAEDDDSEFAEYAFLVRRQFDFTGENKYRDTVVDIKSKQLRAALQEVMKDCKTVSLEAEEPCIDPNVLFLYLEELRTYCKKTLKAKIKAEKKRKVVKKLEQQRLYLKTLVAYVDEDYENTKKTLYPLLKAGNITFDLLWALCKPNEVAVTSCYGVWDEPRCFVIDYASKCCTMSRGEWYAVEGRYLEYDGKGFGFGDFEIDIDPFKGPRKISSLAAFPLKYHKDPEGVKKQILARAEKFVNMEGMHYKLHKGLAFMKKKKQVLKININGRVMIDPSTFRRVNPNYPISFVKPKEDDELFDLWDGDSDEDGCSCAGKDSDDEDAIGDHNQLQKKYEESDEPKFKYKWAKNERGCTVLLEVEVDEDGNPLGRRRIDQLAGDVDHHHRSFTEDDLLLTTPVVLGFAFSEKLWLEFTISGVQDIVYNENAFDSLVLPANQKAIVRAQVESHKTYAAKTIDDVVQGKGKGLVAVLHGPPGTGKTLTAEGIAELLKCPLYMVSAGELGTDPAKLEFELQKILDIAHSWGAILLLDEADVFLEKREVHDIHRNALVSIFLRLLEYFQGILFLTTNRVETFDDAFQSRIHIALRYGELTHKAKKSVWKLFLDFVRKTDGMEVAEMTDHDIDVLARNQLNGRQIKNLVRTAQALALHEKTALTLGHIKQVIEVAETFDRDLRGGTGYVEAMRSYT